MSPLGHHAGCIRNQLARLNRHSKRPDGSWDEPSSARAELLVDEARPSLDCPP
jgi:hypothetical protein